VTVAIIGGTGVATLDGFNQCENKCYDTPYGKISSPLLVGTYKDSEITFLQRHGANHSIPPHKINYRANIWSLKQHGIRTVIGLNTVGGISAECHTGAIVIPDQILDYTYGREHTFFDGIDSQVKHVDMNQPYHEAVRGCIYQACECAGVVIVGTGAYAATQGPRFETPAEITRLRRDGAAIVGMTGMPEVGLAKELGLPYASICLVVNAAAGQSGSSISLSEIRDALDSGKQKISHILHYLIPMIADRHFEVVEPLTL